MAHHAILNISDAKVVAQGQFDRPMIARALYETEYEGTDNVLCQEYGGGYTADKTRGEAKYSWMMSKSARVYGDLTIGECEELRKELGEENKFRGPGEPTSYNGVAPKATRTVFKTRDSAVVSYGEFTDQGLVEAHAGLQSGEKIYLLQARH